MLLFAAIYPLVAQESQYQAPPPNPWNSVGLIVIIVAIVRRKQPVGGWLFYFFGQFMLGAVFLCVDLWRSGRNYDPGHWTSGFLYAVFLVRSLPAIVLTLSIAISSVCLIYTGDWKWVQFLRGLLGAMLAISIVGIVLDGVYLRSGLPQSVQRLLFSAVFFPYFLVSRRVKAVYRDKNWTKAFRPPPIIQMQP